MRSNRSRSLGMEIVAFVAIFVALTIGAVLELPPLARRTWGIASKSHRGQQRLESNEPGGYGYMRDGRPIPVVAGGSGESDTITMDELLGEIDKRLDKRFTDAVDPLKNAIAELHQEPSSKPETKDDALTLTMRQFLGDNQDLKAGDLILMDRQGDDWKPRRTDAGELVIEHQTAEMAQSFTAIIEKPLNDLGARTGLQVGSIVVGGSIGLVLGELIDGFVDHRTADDKINPANVFARGATMLLLASPMLNRIVSRSASNAAIVVLGLELLSDISPLDKWVTQFVNFVTGNKDESAGLEQPARHRQITGGHAAAEQPTSHRVAGGHDELLALVGGE